MGPLVLHLTDEVEPGLSAYVGEVGVVEGFVFYEVKRFQLTVFCDLYLRLVIEVLMADKVLLIFVERGQITRIPLAEGLPFLVCKVNLLTHRIVEKVGHKVKNTFFFYHFYLNS